MPRTETAPTQLDETVRQMIAARAYERYLSRGGEHGSDLDDWLAAEAEVLATMRPRTRRSRSPRPRPVP